MRLQDGWEAYYRISLEINKAFLYRISIQGEHVGKYVQMRQYDKIEHAAALILLKCSKSRSVKNLTARIYPFRMCTPKAMRQFKEIQGIDCEMVPFVNVTT